MILLMCYSWCYYSIFKHTFVSVVSRHLVICFAPINFAWCRRLGLRLYRVEGILLLRAAG